MGDAREIASRALEFASEYLEDNSRELVAMADGDLELLHDAAKLVQAQAQGQKRASLSAEHLAFTLITAAYESLRGDHPKP